MTHDTSIPRAGADPLAQRHLVPLEELHDYKVADGDPDIRGWEVRSFDGTRVGRVASLVVDTDALKVRYIEVDLDRAALGLDHDRHAVLPIGTARLDDAHDLVFLGASSTMSELTALSDRERRPLDRDRELALLRRLDRDYPATPPADFYDHPHYDEDRFFGSRRTSAGRAAYLARTGATVDGRDGHRAPP